MNRVALMFFQSFSAFFRVAVSLMDFCTQTNAWIQFAVSKWSGSLTVLNEPVRLQILACQKSSY